MKLGRVSTYLDFACSQLNITCLLFGWELRMSLDARCWILDAGYSMLDIRCWMLDAGCWMLDTRYSMLDSRFSILNAGCSILDARYSMICIYGSVRMSSSIEYPASSITVRLIRNQRPGTIAK